MSFFKLSGLLQDFFARRQAWFGGRPSVGGRRLHGECANQRQ